MLNTMSSAHNKIFGAKFLSFERLETMYLYTASYADFWQNTMKSDSQKSLFSRKRIRDASIYTSKKYRSSFYS